MSMRKQGDIYVQEYMVECRHADGSLNVNASLPQGLTMVMTEDEIYRYYFDNHPDAQTAQMHEVSRFLEDQGIYYRAKTW